jgi:hypothetical protein
LIHAIETLHGLIESGEIMRRREATGRGAEFELVEPASAPSRPVPVALGATLASSTSPGAR